jgi:hypothetical protein
MHPHCFHNFGKTGESKFHDKKQNVTYYRRPALLGPYVVKMSSSGEKKVIIKTPFHKRLFKGPLPAWFFGIVGGVISVLLRKNPLERFLRKKQIKNQV